VVNALILQILYLFMGLAKRKKRRPLGGRLFTSEHKTLVAFSGMLEHIPALQGH
jgi:hypothetical protein